MHVSAASPLVPEANLAGVRPPRQERSRRTLLRILDAMEVLLEEKLFEDITIADVVRAAATSVGAFYTRFPQKESLLPALYERYDKTLTEQMEEVLAPELWVGLSLVERAERLVGRTVRSYRQRRGLMRAVTAFARQRPKEISPAIRSARTRLHRGVVEVLLEKRGEIEHPDPERAVEMGLFFVISACREKILFGNAPHAESVVSGDEALVQEMTRALVLYLGVPMEAPVPLKARSKRPSTRRERKKK